jgi:hypothetical protein
MSRKTTTKAALLGLFVARNSTAEAYHGKTSEFDGDGDVDMVARQGYSQAGCTTIQREKEDVDPRLP